MLAAILDAILNKWKHKVIDQKVWYCLSYYTDTNPLNIISNA